MPRFQAVILDFDYTLGDSSPGAVECFNYALRRMGLPPASAERICATIGLPLSRAFPLLVDRDAAPDVEELTRLFVERADQVMLEHTTLLPGVPEALRALRRCGLRLGVFTLKYRRRIEWVLRRDGLADAFDVIVGGEDVHAPKPDPGGLLLAMERLRVSAQETLYVGDTVLDAEAAARAAVAFCAVRSGLTPPKAWEDYPTWAVLDSVTELPARLGCDQAAGLDD